MFTHTVEVRIGGMETSTASTRGAAARARLTRESSGSAAWPNGYGARTLAGQVGAEGVRKRACI